jgi:hypothetical protein
MENCCECGNEPSDPQNAGKLSSVLTAGGRSSSVQLHGVSSM